MNFNSPSSYSYGYTSQPLRQSGNLEYQPGNFYNSSTVQKSPHESAVVFSQSLQSPGGLTDAAGAKAVAKRLMDLYDRDRDGNINNMEVVPMMVDAYQIMNRRFQPSKQDIDSFFRVCDKNKDGRINYEDLEAICLKYLTTPYMKEEMGGYR